MICRRYTLEELFPSLFIIPGKNSSAYIHHQMSAIMNAALAEDKKYKVCLRTGPGAPFIGGREERQVALSLSGSSNILYVQQILRKKLGAKLKQHESIYVYCGNERDFAPNPYQTIEELFECFEKEGELIVTYAVQEAFG